MTEITFQAPSPEYLDELLPQYDVEAFVAQGGMGAVYKARQCSLDRDVAIKVLPQELGEDEEFRESFTTEAKAMARLNHPNLLGVLDFGDVDGMPYIAMEYVHGQSLHNSAWNQVVEPSQAVAIVKGICDGLAHAHEHGIVHRDVKPANILLTPKAEPKIGDFGLAHAADSDTTGVVMGTPGYTAPEVFYDPDQAGPLADLYSVGVILHQLLTGIDPAGSEGPPTQATGNLRLDTIWRKATNIDPAQRYPSVAAMAADLEKVSAPASAVPAPGRPMPFRTTPQPLASTSGGGGGVVVTLLIVAVFGIVSVFVYQALQSGDEGSGSANLPAEEEKVAPAPLPDPQPDPPREGKPVLDPDPPELVVDVDPTPMPEPDPIEGGTVEEPVTPPVVDVDPVEPEDLPPGDPALRERAVGLIVEAREKRDAELAANVRSFVSKLDVRARIVDPDEVRLIEFIKNDLNDNRVPDPDATASLPGGLAEACKNAHREEESIDARHRAELTRIRNSYTTRLASAAGESTDEELKQRLLAQAERAGDLDAWIDLMAPESERVAKKSSYGFAGKWYIHAYKGIKKWVAHSDGKMTTLEAEWEGTWRILEDGTLVVKWPDKDPFIFTRDGEGWKGKNPFGGKASLTQGDW